MNMTDLLNRVKRRLGLKYSNIPIDDQDLIDTIIEESLPTFSGYFQYNINMPLDLSESNKIPGEKYGYFINTDVLADGMSILGVSNVSYEDIYRTYGDMYYNGISPIDFISSAANANLSGVTNIPITWNFQEPNRIIFDEAIESIVKLNLELVTTHNPSLITIPKSRENEFIKLVLLDIKIFLYNNFKHYDNIDSPFGQINLRLDDWNGAEGDRESLLQKWDETFIYSTKYKIYHA